MLHLTKLYKSVKRTIFENKSTQLRFAVTFTSNLARSVISFGANLTIARHLGPKEFGRYNFLLSSFTSIASLADMASSSAFFTFISQKRRGIGFFLYYLIWILIQLTFITLLPIILSGKIFDLIWLNHSLELVIMAVLSGFMANNYWRMAGQIGESIRDTARFQLLGLVLAVIYLVGLHVLFSLNFANLKTLYLFNIITYLLFASAYLIRVFFEGAFYLRKKEKAKLILKEFSRFCSPMVIYTLASTLYTFSDNWLLQRFGGAQQQGFYAIGAKFSSISLLATASILNVLWKEIAEAHSIQDFGKVRRLYNQVSRGLFFFAALISGCLIPFSKEILGMLLGPDYVSANLILIMMFIYPIHQSTGQITGTMFYALEKTKTQSSIGIGFIGISLVLGYIFLAPPSAIVPGLNLAALGLAIKMVVCQLLQVNLSMFFVARYIQSNFDWKHQFYVLGLILSVGFISKFIVGSISAIRLSIFWYITLSTSLYLSIIVLVLFQYPSLVGLEKDSINRWLHRIRHKLQIVKW